MCIKRRKNPGKAAHPPPTDVSSDGGPTTHDMTVPGLRNNTRDERKLPVTSGSERKVSTSYRKFSSTTGTTGGSGSCIAKNKFEQVWTRDDNKASAETDVGNPMPLRSENQELPQPPLLPSHVEVKEPEGKEVMRKVSASPERQPAQTQPQPQLEQLPEPKFDKTQDLTEEMPLATTQVPSQRKPKPKYRAASSAKVTPTDFKGKTTPLMTDYMEKKIEKDPQLQELSRRPVVKTSNIAYEKFPYTNAGHQDTMAGMTSNFSDSMELPDDKQGHSKKESKTKKEKKDKEHRKKHSKSRNK